MPEGAAPPRGWTSPPLARAGPGGAEPRNRRCSPRRRSGRRPPEERLRRPGAAGGGGGGGGGASRSERLGEHLDIEGLAADPDVVVDEGEQDEDEGRGEDLDDAGGEHIDRRLGGDGRGALNH